LIAHAVSKAARKPRAIPVPVGQKGLNQLEKLLNNH
jgi:hypothetical protein